MEGQYSNSEVRKIQLRWRVLTFIPISDNEIPKTIEEFLDPKEFASEENRSAYWSVPERLIDIRWISERSRMEKTTADWQESDFFLCEFSLYRIIVTLGEWSATYLQCIKDLEEDDEKQKWEKLWKEKEPFLKKCANLPEEDWPDSQFQEDLRDLLPIAKLIEDLRISDDRRKALRKTAGQLVAKVAEQYRTQDENEIFLTLFTAQENRSLKSLAADFSRKLVDFFQNPLWRTTSIVEKKLQDFTQKMEKINAGWHPAPTGMESREYQDSVWDGLQQIADNACQKINMEERSGSISISEILRQAEAVISQLGLQSKNSKYVQKQLQTYRKDAHRCIALLEMSNGSRIMAFSGFLDCEDSDTQKVLECTLNTNIINSFKAIAGRLDAKLAVLSREIVDTIMRYTLNPDFQFSEYGPLRKELSSPLKPVLKRDYSCCERKILAAIKAWSTPASGAATLYVKFMPCIICYGALQTWIRDSGVHLRLDYPAQP